MAKKSVSFNKELSDIFTELWNLDVNCCEPDIHYKINMQGALRSSYSDTDVAQTKLFEWIDEEAIFSLPTYKAFKDLLDNYDVDVGDAEVVTHEERKENWIFVDACFETDVWKRTHEFLIEQKLAPSDLGQFKKLVHDMWFNLYRRTHGVLDSSGFEHVFVGEIRGDDVLGLHNWIQFYLQEKGGKIDYKGFFNRGTSNEESPRVITIKFIWGSDSDQNVKPVGSTLVGTSPELELALYTIGFLVLRSASGGGQDKVKVNMAGHNLILTCHTMARNRVGTSFFQGMD